MARLRQRVHRDFNALLGRVESWASERQLRLAVCGYVRLVWDLLDDEARGAVELAEGFADGRTSFGEMVAPVMAWGDLRDEQCRPEEVIRFAVRKAVRHTTESAPRRM